DEGVNFAGTALQRDITEHRARAERLAYGLHLKEDVLRSLRWHAPTADVRLGRHGLTLNVLRHNRHPIWREPEFPTRAASLQLPRDSWLRELGPLFPSGSDRAPPSPTWLAPALTGCLDALREQRLRLCIGAAAARAFPSLALAQPLLPSLPSQSFPAN